jgi:hypothetical protein
MQCHASIWRPSILHHVLKSISKTWCARPPFAFERLLGTDVEADQFVVVLQSECYRRLQATLHEGGPRPDKLVFIRHIYHEPELIVTASSNQLLNFKQHSVGPNWTESNAPIEPTTLFFQSS